MKKLFLFLVACVAAMTLNAQLLLNETFNYTTSTLASVAGDPNTSATNNTTYVWYETGKTTDSNSASLGFSDPIYYTDYISSGLGKSVVIDWGGAGANTRIDVCRFIPLANKFNPSTATSNAYSGKLYYAFLLQVNNAASFSAGADGTDWRDIFCIAGGGSDILGNEYRGRFYVKQDATDPSIIHYTITKNTTISSAAAPTNEGTFPAGQTVLVVIRQNFLIDATTNPSGTVEVIINPVISNTEPTSGWLNGTPGDANTFGGTYGVAIRRRALGSTASMLIGGLRVAQTWSDLSGLGTGISQVNKDNNGISSFGKTIVTNGLGNVKVFNIAGSEMINAKTTGRLETSLQKGLYLVRFIGADGKMASGKVALD
ncbi:MAG TPA: hypothetical protein VIK55_20320 [Paludibacter sp.]